MLWCGLSRRDFLRKAAILLGIVVVLVLAGLILAPQLVDLDHFKAPIAAELSERAGRPVELAGPIALSLLPFPAVTARDLRVANPPGAAVASMVRLRALEVKLALLPLLAGRIELNYATLVEPEIDLERLPNGAPNWRSPAAAPAPNRAGAPSEPGRSHAAAAIASLVRLTIQNGAVTWRGDGGIERFEHINADATFDPVFGQVGAAGNFVARGAAVSFELKSGMLEAAEMPLQLTVTTKPVARLQLDALLSGPLDDRRIAGKLKLGGDDARTLLGTLARIALPAALAQPIAASADLAGSMRKLTLDHLALDLGPAHAEGSLHVEAGTPPALALRLSVGQLDLDRWPAARDTALAPAPFGRAFVATPAAGAFFLPAQGGGSGLPAGIKASVDVGVDAALWRGGLLRDARLKLTLADGRLTLERLAALLPGGTDLSLSGGGALAPDGPHAEAVLAVNADDLRSLCAWLGVAIDSIPADRLRRATLASRLVLAGDRLDVDAIDATLDATRLSGAATVLLRARPGIGLRIVADRLNLDAYLPQPVAQPPAGAAPATSASAASGGGAPPGFDVNLDARVHALAWHGQPMSDVHLSGTLQSGEVTIRELGIGDLGGASANLSGVIEGLTDTPTGQLAFDMHGPELERVLRVLAPELARGRHYGAFSLGGGLQYDRQTVTVDTDLQLIDGHAHIVGDIARPSGMLDLGFDLDHPSFARMVQVFSPLYQSLHDAGPVKLSGRLSGELHRFALEPLALVIGQSTLQGRVVVDLSGAKTQLDADLAAGDWAVDRLLSTRQTAAIDQSLARAAAIPGILLAAARAPQPSAGWSDEPVDFSLLERADLSLKLVAHSLAYGGWRLDTPFLTASVKDGVLSLQQLTGTLLGGSLEASGRAGGGAMPSLEGRLTLKDADLKQALTSAGGAGFVEGRFDVDGRLASAGNTEAALVSHLTGDAGFESRGGSIAGVNLKAIHERLASRAGDLAVLLRSGAGGRTAFSTLKGSFHFAEGIASSDDLQLQAEDGEGRATLSLDLPKWTMTSRVEFRLAGIADAPPLVMRLEGPIDAPRTLFDVNALEQYLARRMEALKPPP